MVPAIQAAAEAVRGSGVEKKIRDAIYDIQSNTQFLAPSERSYREELERSEGHLYKALDYLSLVLKEIGNAEDIVTAATTVKIE